MDLDISSWLLFGAGSLSMDWPSSFPLDNSLDKTSKPKKDDEDDDSSSNAVESGDGDGDDNVDDEEEDTKVTGMSMSGSVMYVSFSFYPSGNAQSLSFSLSLSLPDSFATMSDILWDVFVLASVRPVYFCPSGISGMSKGTSPKYLQTEVGLDGTTTIGNLCLLTNAPWTCPRCSECSSLFFSSFFFFFFFFFSLLLLGWNRSVPFFFSFFSFPLGTSSTPP